MLTINVTNWKLMTIFFFERKMHRGLGLILTFRKDMLAVVSINHWNVSRCQITGILRGKIVDVTANIVCSINVCGKKGKHQLQRKIRNGRLICQWTVIRINKESRQKASAGRLFPFFSFFFLPFPAPVGRLTLWMRSFCTPYN